MLEYKKKKYFDGSVVIGKERPDINTAATTETIRVLYEDRPGVGYDILRSSFQEAPAPLAAKYPNGAWIVSEADCKQVIM